MTHITLHAPAPVAMPRGAQWAASAFTGLLQAAQHAWRAQAEYRARRRIAEEAAELRRYAAAISLYDPAFAADLAAAADRHFNSEE